MISLIGRGYLEPWDFFLLTGELDQSCSPNRPEMKLTEVLEPRMCVISYLKLAMPISPQLGWAPLF